jgi:hypothetical protein
LIVFFEGTLESSQIDVLRVLVDKRLIVEEVDKPQRMQCNLIEKEVPAILVSIQVKIKPYDFMKFVEAVILRVGVSFLDK